MSTGVYGRVLVHLHRRTQSEDQSKLRIFSPGDIIGVYEAGGQGDKGPSAEGIVYKVTGQEIIVAFTEMHEFEEFKQPMSLAKLANEITYQRCKMAMT